MPKNIFSGIALLGIPKFDGKGSIKKFLKTIDKRGRIERWTRRDKCRIIRCLCTDAAESFLDVNPQLANASYDLLCQKLIGRFDFKLSKAEAYDVLMSVKQRDSSIEDFAFRIEKTASEHDDVITELKDINHRDEILISAFLAGVNLDIKRSLVVVEHSKFETLIHTAKRLERAINSQRNTAGGTDKQERSTYEQTERCHYDYKHRSSQPDSPYGSPPYFEQNYWHTGGAYRQHKPAYFKELENVNRDYQSFAWSAGVLITVAVVMTLIILMVKMLEG